MEKFMQHKVVIFGSSLCPVDSPEYDRAEKLGYALAEAGYGVANGGYCGTMEASSKGARDHPGIEV